MSTIYDLHKRATNIVESSALSWEQKYELIFNKSMSREVFSWFKGVGLELNYYDPDTSYEEDVRAFMFAFDEKVEFIRNNEFLNV